MTILSTADIVANEELPNCTMAPTDLTSRRADQVETRRADPWQSFRRFALALILAIGDVLCFGLAVCGLAMAGFLQSNDWTSLAVVSLAWPILQAVVGLYPGYEFDLSERLRLSAMVTGAVLGIGTLVSWVLTRDLVTCMAVASAIALAAVVQIMLRPLLRSLLRSIGLWGERFDLIARPDLIPLIKTYFQVNWQLGLRPENASFHGESQGRSRWVLVTDMPQTSQELDRLCRDYQRVFLLADTPHFQVSGLGPRNTGGRIGICIGHGRRRSLPEWMSRLIELLCAATMLMLVLPVLAIAALAIRIVDPGPVVFVQEREGLNGRKFRILKLRTMFLDSDARLERLLASSPAAAREWASNYKLKKDPRVLPFVGRALRALSLDELPQLVNIIRGDMRLVGPRPFPEYHLAAMGEDFRRKRHRLTPGLTGLWQVSARGDADVELQQRLDEFYIDNKSFWLDLHIVLSTLRAVFNRSGAY